LQDWPGRPGSDLLRRESLYYDRGSRGHEIDAAHAGAGNRERVRWMRQAKKTEWGEAHEARREENIGDKTKRNWLANWAVEVELACGGVIKFRRGERGHS